MSIVTLISDSQTYGICQKALAKMFSVGKATIERWYHHYYYLAKQTLSYHECPRILGIDEHRFGKQFATTFCDLRHNRVFDITLGRSKASLSSFLESLKGRDKVQVICIDLSATYKSIIKEYFPNAKIVADRFHVIRQVNQQFLQVYQTLDTDLKYHRGLLAALRSNPQNLTEKRRKLRDQYLFQ